MSRPYSMADEHTSDTPSSLMRRFIMGPPLVVRNPRARLYTKTEVRRQGNPVGKIELMTITTLFRDVVWLDSADGIARSSILPRCSEIERFSVGKAPWVGGQSLGVAGPTDDL